MAHCYVPCSVQIEKRCVCDQSSSKRLFLSIGHEGACGGHRRKIMDIDRHNRCPHNCRYGRLDDPRPDSDECVESVNCAGLLTEIQSQCSACFVVVASQQGALIRHSVDTTVPPAICFSATAPRNGRHDRNRLDQSRQTEATFEDSKLRRVPMWHGGDKVQLSGLQHSTACL